MPHSVRPGQSCDFTRKLYENQQFQFTGNYGDDGFLEEYTCQIQGQPTRLMGKKYAGTPLAKYFISRRKRGN